MDIDKVIQLKEQINVDYSMWTYLPNTFWIILVILIVLGLYFIFFTFGTTGFVMIVSAFWLFFGGFIYTSNGELEHEELLIQQWKEDVVIPFINSLPKEKHEIIFIKIDSELSHNTSGNLFYTYSEEITRTPLTISYKDNGISTKTNWYETHMELTDEERPYIEFQVLEKDLEHWEFPSGIYNAKVYLPESYTFTDIK